MLLCVSESCLLTCNAVNGTDAYLRLEAGHPSGHFARTMGGGDLKFGKSSGGYKVATIMDSNTWRWPRQRNRVARYIISHTHVFLSSSINS